jgi:hypothetical protein
MITVMPSCSIDRTHKHIIEKILHVAHSLLARIIHLLTALAISVFGSLPQLERWQIITAVTLHLHCVRNM